MSFAHTDSTRERLVADLKSALSHAEEFVNASATQSGEKLVQARSKVEAALKDVRERLADAEDRTIRAARDATETTERSIKEHPWTAVGIGAGVGLLLGLLLGRR